MAATLLLDNSSWDLCLDASGNIAVATEPYARAQDAASSIRTFAGEVYYDITRGVPYFDQILGHYPPVSLMKSYFEGAAQRSALVRAAGAAVDDAGDLLSAGPSEGFRRVLMAELLQPVPYGRRVGVATAAHENSHRLRPSLRGRGGRSDKARLPNDYSKGLNREPVGTRLARASASEAF